MCHTAPLPLKTLCKFYIYLFFFLNGGGGSLLDYVLSLQGNHRNIIRSKIDITLLDNGKKVADFAVFSQYNLLGYFRLVKY